MGDESASEQREAHRSGERQEHPRPGARLEAGDLGLRVQNVGVHGLGQRVEVRFDAIGQRPRRALGQGRRARPLAARQQRPDLADRSHVALEAGRRLVEEARLGTARRIGAQAIEVGAHAVGPIVPGRHEPRILQYQEPGLEPDHRRHHVTRRRGQPQRRHGAGGDLAVDGGEAPDGAQAEDAHDCEHDDHHRGRQEDLRGEPHCLPLTPRESMPLPAEAPEPAGLP